MKYMKKILVLIFICNNFMQSTVVGQINKQDDVASNTTINTKGAYSQKCQII